MLYSSAILFLRGLFHISKGSIIEGFRDFYAIELKEIFPRMLIIEQILPLLSNEQKDLILVQPFYRSASEHKRVSHVISSHISFVNSKFSVDIVEDGGYVNLSDLSKNYTVLYLP